MEFNKKKIKKIQNKIIPVDSEHFSIFKLLKLHNLKEIEKIYNHSFWGTFFKFK